MNDMTLAGIGHNGSPDPLDEAMAPYAEALELADGMLTGKPVENDAQMNQVDAVAKDLKAAKKAAEDAKEGEYRPFKEGCDRIVKKYAPTLKDLDLRIKGCAAMVSAYKVEKDRIQKEAERKARAEAERTMREAEEAARLANVADLDAQHEAEAKMRAAREAVHVAAEIKRDAVKGLRTVTKTVVLDPVGLARALWVQDREAQLAFQADRARILKLNIPGVVEQRQEKEAF